MKRKAPSLKIWLGVILCFGIFQLLQRLYFEEKIFSSGELKSLSDGHFLRLESDFQNASSDVFRVAVLGSSRVAKGIECPDEVRNILKKKNMPPIQLNKVWESFDPFKEFVQQKRFLERLIPLEPDLVCIQADMLAIQMTISADQEQMKKEEKFKKIWDLEYKGDTKNLIPKKIKYQSKINQELIHSLIVGNAFSKGKSPCKIHDIYTNIDTFNHRLPPRNVKKIEAIQYAFDDLEMLKNAGIKVVIIETPLPVPIEEKTYTSTFNQDLLRIQKIFKNELNIDYWDYTGPPLYYRYYADGGHLNPEGRSIYTEWLLDRINKEIPTH